MTTKQLKDGSRFNANCDICNERYFENSFCDEEYVCNKCVKAFLYGIMKERNKWEEWTGQNFFDMDRTNGEILQKKLKHKRIDKIKFKKTSKKSKM